MKELKIFCDICGKLIAKHSRHPRENIRFYTGNKQYHVCLHLGAYCLCKSCRVKYGTKELRKAIYQLVEDIFRKNRENEIKGEKLISNLLKPFFKKTGLKLSERRRRFYASPILQLQDSR